ncbi:riboflavin biosynthesis protein RibF [Ligilactobacillus salivarius]|jgi:riboflavin kinase/FMN adenylyltransferase|uniref:Riboflavin biosynthesis protein n=3 Tax=Ligilactobacillus salivarius TaxID=1624 RepID=A0A1V9U799_9LACO|nr:riboflavin biosynthesis protein RibF [Ligilactobacillus salivarius]ATP37764.1 bifunctional riboflavin kinase/FAD synthetase [Ligilactobacillus salivarius]EEJ74998.1 riboflavin biosynthesis protein RibF [Ligilactobacillus salivarius DSM 20555 = ATCC 11741]KRM70459.1 FAD synthetase [Ligilactobacillus salivarius DSM 20555 = ATCC 11741]MBE7937455.1 riboflavin biosynthesis protein RibF [Ligilactobacillus salivarius]MDG9755916.1 riboflavin biosynthesis protein RibF [Ligilactobacillus salivarius]
MKIVKLKEPYDKNAIVDSPIVLALGFFDGVHRGHQEVIKRAIEKGKSLGVKVAVMTFDRHPKIIFQNIDGEKFKYLTMLDEKLEHFKNLGVDIAYVVKFDENLAYLSPQDFIDKYVVGLHAICVVAGQDYTYGKHDIANMDTISDFAKGRFEIITVDHLQRNDQKISSTQIRKDLDSGNVEAANLLLGYQYENHGTVEHGFKRGRKIGFPTLNVSIPKNERILGEGVYAVKVKIDKDNLWYEGMASIGHNETFGDDLEKTVEINLFNFDKSVYGEKVIVKWYKFLREMVKFDSVEELIDQLNKDKRDTEVFFGDLKKN